MTLPATEVTSQTAVAVQSTPSADWDAFVRQQPGAPIYFLSGWTLLARDVFRHRVFFIEARNRTGELVGALPVVQQRGLLGNFATSIPFFNYGGALARNAAARSELMARARDLAGELGCSYLELRDTDPQADGWQCRTDKVTMILQLPASPDILAKQLGSKLRSQVKRADREPLAVRTGGSELVDDFYDVFAHNMRDLGTPVYPKRFFHAITSRFPDHTRLIVIDHRGMAAAAGFVVLDGKRAEIPWASCRAEAKSLGLNMKLYWEVLSFAIGRGCTSFDFGRSTLDSGTYKFKKQWGAEPLQLHWYRWERTPSPDGAVQGGNEGRLMQFATSIWQRLPVKIANVLGPIVSPGLPW
jgi:serine/alanine adding enzyme